MLSQSQVKYISSLKIKKFRAEHRQFIAEGSKLVLDLVQSRFVIAGIYASAEWIVSNLPLIRGKNIPVHETLPREMERISGLSTPGPVLAVVNMPSSPGPGQTFSMPDPGSALILALDDIRDPGNLGTIIRIADWFGIGTVLCSENCVEIYNPKVVQATMGSIARVNVMVCNLAEYLSTLTGTTTPTGSTTPSGSTAPVYGAYLEGDSIYLLDPVDHGIILIGNESHGISPGLKPFITRKIFIPSFEMNATSGAESLNASIAAAIICAEFRRKQFKIE